LDNPSYAQPSFPFTRFTSFFISCFRYISEIFTERSNAFSAIIESRNSRAASVAQAMVSPDAATRNSAAATSLVEAFDRPVALAPPAGIFFIRILNALNPLRISDTFYAAPAEFKDLFVALSDAANSSDEEQKAAAVSAAAAVAAVAAQAAASKENQAAKDKASVFVLLHRTLNNTVNVSTEALPGNASVTDIQSRRIADLEAALQAERDSNTHFARQLWHMQNKCERDAFEHILRSVPSTPRVVETPRDIARDVEKADILQQLHQARAEALHFKSEYDKFVVSYEHLGENLTRASERVEKMMQVTVQLHRAPRNNM
jgi:hypothetical protein